MERSEKAYLSSLDKLRKKNLSQQNRVSNTNVVNKTKIKTVTKKVVMLKSEMDIAITKSELICIKKVLCEYLKTAHSRYRKNGSFYVNTSDATERYLYMIYSNVFKSYNKLNGKNELSPIYQTNLINIENEKLRKKD